CGSTTASRSSSTSRASGAPVSDLERRFRAVARERLAKLRTRVAALAEGAASSEDADEIRRELHTLKGEARVVGVRAVGDAAHALEELARGELGEMAAHTD